MTKKDVREMHKLLQATNADVEEMLQGTEQHQFLTLARKYATHDGFKCEALGCMICEALGTIENTQFQLASMEFDKRHGHALQNSDLF